MPLTLLNQVRGAERVIPNSTLPRFLFFPKFHPPSFCLRVLVFENWSCGTWQRSDNYSKFYPFVLVLMAEKNFCKFHTLVSGCHGKEVKIVLNFTPLAEK